MNESIPNNPPFDAAKVNILKRPQASPKNDNQSPLARPVMAPVFKAG